jgi:hypothetical protein
LAWFFVYGEFPVKLLDHIDEVRHHNWIDNLRECTNSQNLENVTPINSRNTSGYKGVCWNKQEEKWVAQLSINKKQRTLGYYSTPEKAHEAYIDAKRKHHTFWVEK